MSVYKFIIKGNPAELTHYPRLSKREMDKQKETRLIREIDLQRQVNLPNENQSLFQSPISVNFIFHFYQRARHPYHTFYPAVHNLIANYIIFARKYLWRDLNIIIDEHGSKVYDNDEYTEIIITPIDNHGKKQ